MEVKELMTRHVDSAEQGCSILTAARMMRRHNIGMLPVLIGKRLAGVVTDRDIVLRAVSKDAALDTVTVGEIMTRKPISCREDDDLVDVAKLMEEKKIRRMPVINRQEKLVGVISLDDFARRLAGQDVVGEVLEAVGARRC